LIEFAMHSDSRTFCDINTTIHHAGTSCSEMAAHHHMRLSLNRQNQAPRPRHPRLARTILPVPGSNRSAQRHYLGQKSLLPATIPRTQTSRKTVQTHFGACKFYWFKLRGSWIQMLTAKRNSCAPVGTRLAVVQLIWPSRCGYRCQSAACTSS
jgi:hypothetical protein